MEIFAPLAEGRHPRRYQAGQVIYLQDSPADEFYYLVRGTARSYISSQSGGERILSIHRAGDLMGEASFFDECPRVSSAVTVTDCEIVSVDRGSTGQGIPSTSRARSAHAAISGPDGAYAFTLRG